MESKSIAEQQAEDDGYPVWLVKLCHRMHAEGRSYERREGDKGLPEDEQQYSRRAATRAALQAAQEDWDELCDQELPVVGPTPGKWRVEWRMAWWPMGSWTRFVHLSEELALRTANQIYRLREAGGDHTSVAIRVYGPEGKMAYNEDSEEVRGDPQTVGR